MGFGGEAASHVPTVSDGSLVWARHLRETELDLG